MKRTLSLLTVIGLTSLLIVPQVTHADVPASALPGFEDLAEKLLPTVVNISTTTNIKAAGKTELPPMPELPPGSPFEQFFKDFYDNFQNGMPQDADKKASALGSGFIVDAEKGYVVTNNHVIKDADEIRVILHDDTSIDARLIGTDEKTDIAVLQFTPTTKVTATTWGDSDTAKVGSWIVAIGNPFGLGGTVTAGIVSARQRDINAGPYDDFIQTDASINRGNSGGPMFNTKGQVVGVNTAIFSPSGGSVGIGFAVPSNIVRHVVDQLIKFGKTKRGWLGVRIQEVTPEIADSLGLGKARGALVSSVTEKGPAETAGIISGDIILTIEGQSVDTMRSLPRMVAETEVGKKVKVGLWRKNQQIEKEVTLGQLETAEEESKSQAASTKGEAKKEDTTGDEIKALGISVSTLNDSLREHYKIAKTISGLVVTAVAKNGPAAEKGVAIGDVILEVDQFDAKTVALLKEKVEDAVKKERSAVLLFITRNDNRRFVALKLKK